MSLAWTMTSDAALTATGSTQADAATIQCDFNIATAASVDGTVGVKLPATGKNSVIFLKNAEAATNAVKVYSNTAAGYINGTAGSTAYSLAATKSAMFVNVGSDTWHAILLD